MPVAGQIPVFDGHNDLLLRLARRSIPEATAGFLEGDGRGHLDLPRMRQGGFCGGFFAIFVPDIRKADAEALFTRDTYEVPLPPGVPLDIAQAATIAMAARLFDIERESGGALRVCRTADDLRTAIAADAVAAVLHIEGAEAIDPDFAMLEVMYQAGLRSLGPVWSRPNLFGHGVPFRYPSTPDIGEGLSEHGERLVRECNRRKIMLDLSHLNEKGFWDVARLSDAPLVATHSNAHAICPHSRNLTDKQLAAIKERDGMVGVNYAVSFIRPDGRRDTATPLDMLIDHIVYLIEHLGEDRVGLGSDFDGATVPAEIGTAAGLQNLVAAMRARGFDEPLLRKVCCDNWIAALERSWA